MADNVNGKKIKDLPLCEELSDTDDFILETQTPETKRTKWSLIVSTLKSAFGIEDIQERLDEVDSIYVEGTTLYMGSTVANVSDSTLIIGTKVR